MVKSSSYEAASVKFMQIFSNLWRGFEGKADYGNFTHFNTRDSKRCHLILEPDGELVYKSLKLRSFLCDNTANVKFLQVLYWWDLPHVFAHESQNFDFKLFHANFEKVATQCWEPIVHWFFHYLNDNLFWILTVFLSVSTWKCHQKLKQVFCPVE